MPLLSPLGPPEPIQNCSITNQTSATLMLSCDAGDDGGLPQTFHLEVYSMTAEQLIINLTTSDSPVFVAERLSSSSSYILVLYSSNLKGRSTSVALTARTLFAAEPRTSKSVLFYSCYSVACTLKCPGKERMFPLTWFSMGNPNFIACFDGFKVILLPNMNKSVMNIHE